MTKIQECAQADGPCIPTARMLAEMLHYLPWHVEIRAISVNGQGGSVVVEYMHEGADLIARWDAVSHNPKTNELIWIKH